ncbi:MAG: type IV pilus assembly protein PilM, partial [Longimicrobiales bacterium]
DEVSLDFQVLGPVYRDPNTVDVLLAACRRDQVESRCAALEVAGLTPKIVDLEIYALENACQFLRHQMPDQGKNHTVAVVDMGATTTTLIVLHNLQVIYTRDQPFGGKQLTEDIVKHYGMNFEEAVKAKKAGSLPEGYKNEVLEHFIADVAQQIDRSLQFFFAASSQYTHVDQIVLAGGCAHIPGVDRMLHERLRLPCVIAHPFAHMSVASRAKPQQLAKDEAALLIAAGLAYRAFD